MGVRLTQKEREVKMVIVFSANRKDYELDREREEKSNLRRSAWRESKRCVSRQNNGIIYRAAGT